MTTLRHDMAQKMREAEIVDLSDAEIRRAFAGCVMPNACYRHVKECISAGLTIDWVYDKHNTAGDR